MSSDFMPGERLSPVLKWIIIINCAVFIIQNLVPPVGIFIKTYLSLWPEKFLPFQVITYMFIHGDAMHLFVNMLSLFFIGPSVERVFGSRDFLRYYMICGVTGGLVAYILELTIESFPGNPIVGASGAVFGVFYACYRFFPDAVVNLYFLFPIKLKYLLILFFIIDVAMMLDFQSGTAHYVHVAGVLAGFLYFRYVDSIINWSNNMKRKQQEREEIQEANIKEQVDEILAKISKEGMGSLTDKEKSLLKKASKKYQKD